MLFHHIAPPTGWRKIRASLMPHAGWIVLTLSIWAIYFLSLAQK